MNRKEILELVANGESTRIEFKRKGTTPQKLAKEIAAIANTSGGFLIVGVDDNGKVYGIDSEKSEAEIITTACHFFITPPIEPDIEIISIKDKDILVLSIEESSQKPHRVIEEENNETNNTKVYIRLGEQSVEASREMTRLMRQQTLGKPVKLSIGDKEKRLFAYLEAKERVTVKDFANLVNISERRSTRLLIRLVRAGVLNIHNDTNHDYFTLK